MCCRDIAYHEPEAVEDAATGILVTFATETC
jgi:hypothetical protein